MGDPGGRKARRRRMHIITKGVGNSYSASYIDRLGQPRLGRPKKKRLHKKKRVWAWGIISSAKEWEECRQARFCTIDEEGTKFKRCWGLRGNGVKGRGDFRLDYSKNARGRSRGRITDLLSGGQDGELKGLGPAKTETGLETHHSDKGTDARRGARRSAAHQLP